MTNKVPFTNIDRIDVALSFKGQQQYDYIKEMLENKKKETFKQVEKMIDEEILIHPEKISKENDIIVRTLEELKQKLGELK
jgi:glyceraldehyde-3-phosphate dehydrogenase/erythrose-4-phosphate dehydrogenase